MDDEYRSLAAPFRAEVEESKGSRFLALIAPASSEETAAEHLKGVRSEFPDASHHCWAYRLRGPGDHFRFSDDGEPGGSAGRPILQQIDGHGVVDVSIVVVRWFGGTKLGVGGLMRAYGGAAGRALDAAPIETIVIKQRVDVRYPYECSGAVDGMLAVWQVQPIRSEYADEVHAVFEIALRDVERFRDDLRDRTAGRGTTELP